jgi:hypothetical protein
MSSELEFLKQKVELLESQLDDARKREYNQKIMYESMFNSLTTDSDSSLTVKIIQARTSQELKLVHEQHQAEKKELKSKFKEKLALKDQEIRTLESSHKKLDFDIRSAKHELESELLKCKNENHSLTLEINSLKSGQREELSAEK